MTLDTKDVIYFALMFAVVCGCVAYYSSVVISNQNIIADNQAKILKLQQRNLTSTQTTIINNTLNVSVNAPSFLFVQPSQQCKGKKVEQMSTFDVYGFSMQPYIFDGDTLLIVPYDRKRELVSGDVVVFDRDGLIVHRIIAVYEDYVIIQGDNIFDNNDNVDYSQIRSIVCGVLRG